MGDLVELPREFIQENALSVLRAHVPAVILDGTDSYGFESD
jgi:hypothetical protein